MMQEDVSCMRNQRIERDLSTMYDKNPHARQSHLPYNVYYPKFSGSQCTAMQVAAGLLREHL